MNIVFRTQRHRVFVFCVLIVAGQDVALRNDRCIGMELYVCWVFRAAVMVTLHMMQFTAVVLMQGYYTEN